MENPMRQQLSPDSLPLRLHEGGLLSPSPLFNIHEKSTLNEAIKAKREKGLVGLGRAELERQHRIPRECSSKERGPFFPLTQSD